LQTSQCQFIRHRAQQAEPLTVVLVPTASSHLPLSPLSSSSSVFPASSPGAGALASLLDLLAVALPVVFCAVFCRLLAGSGTSGVGESEANLSLKARVDSLRRAGLRSEGGSGTGCIGMSSSGGVEEELGRTGCGLNADLRQLGPCAEIRDPNPPGFVLVYASNECVACHVRVELQDASEQRKVSSVNGHLLDQREHSPLPFFSFFLVHPSSARHPVFHSQQQQPLSSSLQHPLRSSPDRHPTHHHSIHPIISPSSVFRSPCKPTIASCNLFR
jgi:hypothetical protein